MGGSVRKFTLDDTLKGRRDVTRTTSVTTDPRLFFCDRPADLCPATHLCHGVAGVNFELFRYLGSTGIGIVRTANGLAARIFSWGTRLHNAGHMSVSLRASHRRLRQYNGAACYVFFSDFLAIR